jgi:hypothetical protein
MFRGIFITCAALLHTYVIAQTPTASKEMMQLVRCYEAAQDSAYASGLSGTRSGWIHQKQQESVIKYNAVIESGDTTLIPAAEYLYWAIAMFYATTQQRTAPDSTTAAQMTALLAQARQYVPSVFPMRFVVFGNSVVLRYDDVVADLDLYFTYAESSRSCSECKQLVPHLQQLGLEELALKYQIRHREQCRKWWERLLNID